jgi:hypothetical protein
MKTETSSLSAIKVFVYRFTYNRKKRVSFSFLPEDETGFCWKSWKLMWMKLKLQINLLKNSRGLD